MERDDRLMIRSDWLREEVHGRRLENGLWVFVLPKPRFLKKHALLAARYGSIDVSFRAPWEAAAASVPEGIAHFLEHKLFEREGGNAFDRFSQNGAYCNAYTSYTVTAYHFSCTDLFDENLRLLIDFLELPPFTEEAIAREKEIIGQEIKMYEDSPDWRGLLNLLDALYVVHPVKVDIIGTGESIARIDKAALDRCYRAFYQPPNMALFATGDLDPEAVFATAARAFEARPLPAAAGDPVRVAPAEPPGVARARAEARLDVAHPRALLGFKDRDVGFDGPALLRKDIEMTFILDLAFGRSSSFFQRHYESGLLDQSFQATYAGERDHGHAVLGGETEDPERLHQAILEELRTVKASGFAASDFERIKRKAMGRFLRSFNSLEFVANGFVASHFLRFGFFDYLPALDAVRLEDLHARLETQLDEARSAVSILRPA